MNKAYSAYGTYDITVRLKDKKNALSGWSDPHSVVIGHSQPLTPAILAGPDSIWFTNSATFLVAGSDPDREKLRFKFAWGDGDTSDWLEPNVGDTAISTSYTWDSAGRFDVTVRAEDTTGDLSSWSSSKTVVVRGLDEKWFFKDDSGPVTTPVIMPDGAIVFADRAGIVREVSTSGGEVWKYAMGAAPGSSPSVAASGTVFILGSDGNLDALSTAGKLLWQHQVGGQLPPASRNYDAPPSISGERIVYVPGDSLYALDEFGALKWRIGRPNGLVSSPAIAANGTIYVRFGDTLDALTADSLTTWSRYVPAGGGKGLPPSVGADGTVYCSGTDGLLYALSPTNGVPLWTVQTSGETEPVLGLDGTIYVESNQLLVAVSPTGSVTWTAAPEDPSQSWSAPVVVVADSAIYAPTRGSSGSSLLAFNHASTIRWDLAADIAELTSPCISTTGVVYVATDSGLMALSGSSALAKSAWPCARHDSQHTSWEGWAF